MYGQLSLLSFTPNDCALDPSPYTYVNTFSGGGSGSYYSYTIYHNSTPVFVKNGSSFNSFSCVGLRFFNDSIGFMAENSQTSGTTIYKTSDYGATWVNIGGWQHSYTTDFYILNEHYVYSFIRTVSGGICAPLNSDLQSQTVPPRFVPITDISWSDTITGNNPCNLDSISISFLNSGNSDTVTVNYSVNFRMVGLIEQNNYSNMEIFPNPASDYFGIKNEGLNPDKISLTDILGNTIKIYDKEISASNNYPIGNLEPGIYFFHATYSGKTFIKRLVIN